METNAVVLAVKNRKAVVLASGGIYAEVPDQHYFVGQRIAWARKQSHALRWAVLLAACLTLLLSSGFAASKFLPWTVVSVALGETAVQYRLNAWNEVLSAETATEDGQSLLKTVEAAAYEPLETVMQRTLSVIRQQETEPAVTVEIASRVLDGRRAEEAVTEAGKASDIPVQTERISWQEAGKPKEPPAVVREPEPPQPQQETPGEAPIQREITTEWQDRPEQTTLQEDAQPPQYDRGDPPQEMAPDHGSEMIPEGHEPFADSPMAPGPGPFAP